MKFDSWDKSAAKRQVMIISEPKVGKTLFASTACEDIEDIFYLAADPNGIVTLQTNGLEPPHRKVSGMDPYHETVRILSELAGVAEAFHTIVIDDISTLQNKIKSWIERHHKNVIETKQGNKDPRKVYGLLNDYMTDILYRTMDLPSNVVWLTWAKEGSDETPGTAMLEGQFRGRLVGAVDVVGLLHLAKVKGANGVTRYDRVLYTEPFNGYALGNRIGLPYKMAFDLVPSNDGSTPPTWSKGLQDVLEWNPGGEKKTKTKPTATKKKPKSKKK